MFQSVLFPEECPAGCDGKSVCPACNPNPAIFDDDRDLTDEELAAGQAGFDASFPILTRPGENLIDTVQAGRDEGSDEPDADLDWAKHDLPSNDMKPR